MKFKYFVQSEIGQEIFVLNYQLLLQMIHTVGDKNLRTTHMFDVLLNEKIIGRK